MTEQNRKYITKEIGKLLSETWRIKGLEDSVWLRSAVAIVMLTLLASMTLAQCQQTAKDFLDEGDDLRWEGKYNESVESYDEAIKLDPNLAEVWYNKAMALAEQARYDEAIDAIEGAIRIDPNDDKAWTNKGAYLRLQGEYDGALKAFDEAIRINPNNTLAWKNRVMSLEALNKTAEADAAYAKARAKNGPVEPQTAEDLINKAENLNRQLKFDEAIETCDQAIKLDPKNATIWVEKGDLFRIQGRILDYAGKYKEIGAKYDEAIKAYEQAIKLDYPDKVYLWNTIGFLHGNPDESIKAYDQAIKLDPNNTEAWHNKGINLKNMGKYEEAIKAFDEVINKTDRNFTASAWEYKGKALEALGKTTEANDAFDKAKDLGYIV